VESQLIEAFTFGSLASEYPSHLCTIRLCLFKCNHARLTPETANELVFLHEAMPALEQLEGRKKWAND